MLVSLPEVCLDKDAERPARLGAERYPLQLAGLSRNLDGHTHHIRHRKTALIWFCLYAFIAAGFEHSVANMTIFSMVLLSQHRPEISLGGAAYNLFFVTIGNTIAGAGIMGVGYWIAAGRPSGSNQSVDIPNSKPLK